MAPDIHVVFAIVRLTATSQRFGRVEIMMLSMQMLRGLARESGAAHASYVDGCAGLEIWLSRGMMPISCVVECAFS